MIKRYAFLWHVDVEAMTATEGMGGASCESAETEAETEEAAVEKLEKWLEERTRNCKNPKCGHTPVVETILSPKVIMSGMTAGMKKI